MQVAAVQEATSSVLGTFLSQGIVGAIALVIAWVAWRKDQALQEEKDKRLQDAKAFADTMNQSSIRLAQLTDRQSQQIDKLLGRPG